MDWLCQAIGDHTCKIEKLASKTGEPFLVTSKTSVFCNNILSYNETPSGGEMEGEWDEL